MSANLRLEAFGELVPISRLGGQGRVHCPSHVPVELGDRPIVIKLYRRPPPAAAAHILAEMVTWARSLRRAELMRLLHVAAWPLARVSDRGVPVGIAMPDVTRRFAAPFVMPSGRRDQVLLALEHLLGTDAYLQLRGLDVRLDTAKRALIAERISGALAFLHRHAIVASDIAPSNLLVAFGGDGVAVCFIDCDSMVFRGRQALPPVETGDWEMPAAFAEPPQTRAADAYKLGLVILRLFARSHDARLAANHMEHVPGELRELLGRALGANPANRPPAGEWRRALRQLLAQGGLNERYPGPAPVHRTMRSASRVMSPVAAPAQTAMSPVVAPAQHVASAAVLAAPQSTRLAARSRPRPAGGAWLRPAVAALWLIAGTALLALLLSRMFAAAVPNPAPGSSGFGPGVSGFAAPVYGYRYYYSPTGGAAGPAPGPRQAAQVP